MVEKKIIIDKIVEFANTQMNKISVNSPMMAMFKPFVSRAINIKIEQLDKVLAIVTDSKGMVDIEGILNDFVDNLLVAEVKKYSNDFGNAEIGNGQIKFTVPVINKQIVIDTSDIEELKQMITESKN